MGMLNKVKQNKVVADMMLYKFVLSGIPKSGKTTLLYDIVNEKHNGDTSKLLLGAFEKGYNALDGIHAVDINEWEDFQDLVDELIKNKDDVPYRAFGMDTVDMAEKMLVKYVLNKLSIADSKQYKTLQDVAYGKAHTMVETEFIEQIDKLDKSGFSLFYITHNKEKTITMRDGQEVDKLTLSLTGKIKEVVLNNVDFICFIDVVREKVGKENVDKRYIYFRDANIECGSRFANVPDRIPYSAKGFIEVVEDAILAEYNGDKNAVENMKKIQLEEHDEKSNEYIENQKTPATKQLNTADELIEYLKNSIGKFQNDEKVMADIKDTIKKYNNKKVDYTKMTNIENLKAIVEFVDNINI